MSHSFPAAAAAALEMVAADDQEYHEPKIVELQRLLRRI
jgi:hypothetical protein